MKGYFKSCGLGQVCVTVIIYSDRARQIFIEKASISDLRAYILEQHEQTLTEKKYFDTLT